MPRSDNDTASDSPSPPIGDYENDDEAAIIAAAHALAGVPPIRLLKLFSVCLATLAANLHEAAEDARQANPLGAPEALHQRLRDVDTALAQSAELSFACLQQLRAERRRLNGLLAMGLRP